MKTSPDALSPVAPNRLLRRYYVFDATGVKGRMTGIRSRAGTLGGWMATDGLRPTFDAG
jgi:hypothetical protein